MRLASFFSRYALSELNLEGAVTTEQELEYVYFYRVEDLNRIKNKATHEERQEQYELFKRVDTEREITLRVRCVDETTYTLTMKEKLKGRPGKMEMTLPIDKNFFDIFKFMADTGFKKVRYHIPISGKSYQWEVDLYYDKDNRPVSWVKVDLEVPGPIAVPKIPFKFEDAITNQPSQRTPEENTQLERLFKMQYNVLYKGG